MPNDKSAQYGRRLCLMTSLIQACIRTGHCRLESLSQSCGAYSTDKKSSLLQQTKRWLSNKWTDWDSFYMPFAKYFLQGLASKGEIVLIIDGSQTGTANTTLMVSVVCRGFAIPLAWLVKKGEKGHFPEEMHVSLLKQVADLCPQGCRVVVLGDGEFDGQSLHRWCVKQGWQFVTRTSCDRLIDFDGEVARFDSIQTTHRIFFIPNALPMANGVFWHGKGHKKPLYLLTNMDLGREACDYYRRRFKIETMFKHLKSAGFHMDKTRLRCSSKVSNLIIVVAFAFVFSFCMGVFITENEPLENLETIVRKDRLAKITPIAIAQLAINCFADCVFNFFSDLSKNFQWIFT